MFYLRDFVADGCTLLSGQPARRTPEWTVANFNFLFNISDHKARTVRSVTDY